MHLCSSCLLYLHESLSVEWHWRVVVSPSFVCVSVCVLWLMCRRIAWKDRANPEMSSVWMWYRAKDGMWLKNEWNKWEERKRQNEICESSKVRARERGEEREKGESVWHPLEDWMRPMHSMFGVLIWVCLDTFVGLTILPVTATPSLFTAWTSSRPSMTWSGETMPPRNWSPSLRVSFTSLDWTCSVPAGKVSFSLPSFMRRKCCRKTNREMCLCCWHQLHWCQGHHQTDKHAISVPSVRRTYLRGRRRHPWGTRYKIRKLGPIPGVIVYSSILLIHRNLLGDDYDEHSVLIDKVIQFKVRMVSGSTAFTWKGMSKVGRLCKPDW